MIPICEEFNGTITETEILISISPIQLTKIIKNMKLPCGNQYRWHIHGNIDDKR